MAKVLAPLFSKDASGKFLAMVFQSWRGLNVIREFTAPTQPHTVRQLSVRATLTEISKYWANTLNDGLRRAWEQVELKWTDLWGNDVKLTGLNLFLKYNFYLIDAQKQSIPSLLPIPAVIQDTPPPATIPPDIVAELADFTTGQPTISIQSIIADEVTAKMDFVDIWTAGTVAGIEKTNEDAGAQQFTIKMAGLPQGVNPVRSDYKHTAYIKQILSTEDPAKSKVIDIKLLNSSGIAFTEKRRASLLLRRYNKYCRYSSTYKISEVITP